MADPSLPNWGPARQMSEGPRDAQAERDEAVKVILDLDEQLRWSEAKLAEAQITIEELTERLAQQTKSNGAKSMAFPFVSAAPPIPPPLPPPPPHTHALPMILPNGDAIDARLVKAIQISAGRVEVITTEIGTFRYEFSAQRNDEAEAFRDAVVKAWQDALKGDGR